MPIDRLAGNGPVALVQVADLEIDALQRCIVQGTRAVRLSPVEHVVLYTLAARAGSVVSYREIADALGQSDSGRHNTFARHVSSIRRRLGDQALRPRYIETVIGTGYRFVGPQ